jgi:Flp pilus assembly protein TadD
VPPRRPALARILVAGSSLLVAGCGGVVRNDNAEGVRLYQQGNYLGAVDHFQQALARQPGNPDCFYNLGATYHQQAKLFARPADLATAEQYYHLCLARNPGHESCQRALAVLLVEQGRDADAVAQLQSWAQFQPGNPHPHIELARLAQEHGDLREAENQLVDALSRDPNNPRTLVALAHLRELAGDQGQAVANYSRALALDPAQPVVAARMASLTTGVPPLPPTAPAGTPPVAPGASMTLAR